MCNTCHVYVTPTLSNPYKVDPVYVLLQPTFCYLESHEAVVLCGVPDNCTAYGLLGLLAVIAYWAYLM